MDDLRTLVRDEMARAGSPSYSFNDISRRRDRKRRNQRIGAGALAIILALVSFVVLTRAFRTVERPADEPTPRPEGIFSEVGGWIAYGNEEVKQGPLGIWAIDPTRPNDPEARIQLSDRPGTPLAWSSDGSRLLIRRTRERPRGTPGCPRCWRPAWVTLYWLNADGTETLVATNKPKVGGGALGGWIAGGSFSPDGSKVVFAATYERVEGIYTVDADGGTPRLVLAARSDPPNSSSDLFNPAFSPDGTQIAYLDLHGAESPDEAGLSLRVVNADGTGVRVLHEMGYEVSGLGGAAWSPGGTRIAYGAHNSLWVVLADGSGITRMPDGQYPYWSPDGSRIAFELPTAFRQGKLAIANADGTHVQVFGYPAHVGPWNPLLPAVPGEANPTATSSGLAAPFIYAIVLLGVVAVLVFAWRARRRTAAR